MSGKLQITTDPAKLAERAYLFLGRRALLPFEVKPDAWSEEWGEQQAAEQLRAGGRSLQYLTRAVWLHNRTNPNAADRTLAEFAHARALDALVGNSKELVRFLAEVGLAGQVVSGSAGLLSEKAAAVAKAAKALAALRESADHAEAACVEGLKGLKSAAEEAEAVRVKGIWAGARELCLQAGVLAHDVLLAGSGLPAERQLLPFEPLVGGGEKEVVYRDLRRLSDADIDAEDLTGLAFGEFNEALKKRVYSIVQRARG